jgi:hypothetical protein
VEYYSESVKYKFTVDELVAIAREQARHLSEQTRLEEELDSVKAVHKSKLMRLEADISDATRRVSSGYEMRSVRCLVLKFRPDNDSALIVRTDNGRVLRKRRLEADEKQIQLSTDPPLPYAFEVDFYGDTESDVAEMVAEHVPLTVQEVEELKDALKEMRPLRKMIEAAGK